jgi:hypothetical protein
MRRALAAVASALLISVALAGTAFSDPVGYCNVTRGVPGTVLKVKGKDGQAGEWAHLNFNGKVIGGSTVDGYDFWKVVGTVPRHAVPGTYPITVTFEFSTPPAQPCYFRVVRSA